MCLNARRNMKINSDLPIGACLSPNFQEYAALCARERKCPHTQFHEPQTKLRPSNTLVILTLLDRTETCALHLFTYIFFYLMVFKIDAIVRCNSLFIFKGYFRLLRANCVIREWNPKNTMFIILVSRTLAHYTR